MKFTKTPDTLERLASRVDVIDALRVMAGIENPHNPDLSPLSEFNREMERQTGRRANGVFVPHQALVKRDLSVSGSPYAGAAAVATETLGGKFIEMLRPRSRVLDAGATVIGGLTGNVAIPRQTGTASAYWVTEGNAPTESQPAFDQIPMSPKTVGAFTDITRKLLLQSSVPMQNIVMGDLMAVIGEAIDRAALRGTGGAQPTGLWNTNGINPQTIAGPKPTWAEIVSMGTKVGLSTDNAGAAAYMITTAVRRDLMLTEKVANTGAMIYESDRLGGDGTIGGMKALVSDTLPTNLGAGTNEHGIFCGIWSDLVIGLWGAVDLSLDPYTHSSSGGLRITAFQDVDIACRRPQSFCQASYAPA